MFFTNLSNFRRIVYIYIKTLKTINIFIQKVFWEDECSFVIETAIKFPQKTRKIKTVYNFWRFDAIFWEFQGFREIEFWNRSTTN